MTVKRQSKLVGKLFDRLKEQNAAKEAFLPSVVDGVITGDLMIVTAKLMKPCNCDLCGGIHGETITVIQRPPKMGIEKIFAA